MKKHLLFKLLLTFCLSLFLSTGWVKATTLIPGDIAILGMNMDAPDAFTFVTLVDLAEGTEIRFTDSGVFADGTFRGGEGAIKYTVPTGGITAGTILSCDISSLSSLPTNFTRDDDATVGTNGANFSSSGDQLIVFQGVSTNPTFIFALNMDGDWVTEASSSNNSTLPTGLTNGTTALAINPEVDNAVYDMSTTSANRTNLLTAICNIANWTTNDAAALTLPSGTLTILDTDPPVATWNPTDAATGVEPSTAITITFDEAIRDIATDVDFDNTTVDALITTFETVVGSTPVSFDATIDVTNQIITITPDADLAFNTEYTITLAAVEDASDNATTGETITFTTKPETDKDNTVVDPTTQVAATSVESIVTDSIPVFSFTISDLGTADGLDTKVTQITLKAGPNNTFDFINSIDLGYLISETGVSITLGEPVVSAMGITVPIASGDLVIPDGEDSTYTVCLVFNSDSLTDGSVIQLMIEGADHGFVGDPTGSEFKADFGADVVGNEITVNVTATDLHFLSEPVNVYAGNDIEPSVKVQVVDMYGNLDVDYTTDISLTATGSTLVGSPVIATPVMGKATFSSVALSDAATGVTLTAASGTLNTKVSATFDVIAVPATDLFISEYIEGATYGLTALEIYNPTEDPINLSTYRILGSYNGGDWVDGNSYTLPDVDLAAGDVYVITRSDAPQAVKDAADLIVTNGSADGQTYVMGFNGDDARALAKTTNGGTTYDVIDIIGIATIDPGSGWEVAGTPNATADHTLLRKAGTTHGTIDWALSAGTTAENSEWKVYAADFISNIGTPTPEASSETAITKFTFGNEIDVEPATINDATSTIDITVLKDTDPNGLIPTITISDYASVDPASGTAQDFTNPVVYTVTAEDGITIEPWTVNVTVSAVLSSIANIVDVEVTGMDSVEINSATSKVKVYMPYGSDISAVKPIFDISAGATISDTTIAYDFATPKTFTVTAQDGTTIKPWEVTLEVYVPEVVTIHDIQYTEDVSGVSPYLGKTIHTSGIVTAVTSKGYFVQDAAGAWNGVYVYINSAPTVAIGDAIDFVAVVDEYSTLTELKNVQDLSITSQGNTLPAVTTITTLQAQDEDYEGVYIFIDNVECTDTDLGFGMFQVNDGSGALTVDDDMYALTSVLGEGYDITGIGYYSYNERKILPRSANDIVVVSPVIGTPSISPVTPSSTDNVTVSATITDNDNAAGTLTTKLYHGTAAGSENTAVTFAVTTTANKFAGTIPASTSAVYYKITATDGKFSAEKTGNYSIATGINNPDGIVSMNIFPNPSNGNFTLEMSSNKAGSYKVEIINVQGQVVFQKEITQDGFYKETIDISNQAKGIYYIRINDGNNAKISKIMIQ